VTIKNTGGIIFKYFPDSSNFWAEQQSDSLIIRMTTAPFPSKTTSFFFDTMFRPNLWPTHSPTQLEPRTSSWKYNGRSVKLTFLVHLHLVPTLVVSGTLLSFLITAPCFDTGTYVQLAFLKLQFCLKYWYFHYRQLRVKWPRVSIVGILEKKIRTSFRIRLVSWLQHIINRPCHSLIKVVHTFSSHAEAWDGSFCMLLETKWDQPQLKGGPYLVSLEESVLPRASVGSFWYLQRLVSPLELDRFRGTESGVPSAFFWESAGLTSTNSQLHTGLARNRMSRAATLLYFSFS
jgi:hypothetical protein